MAHTYPVCIATFEVGTDRLVVVSETVVVYYWLGVEVDGIEAAQCGSYCLCRLADACRYLFGIVITLSKIERTTLSPLHHRGLHQG